SRSLRLPRAGQARRPALRVYGDVFDFLALPGVGNMDGSVGGLDHRRVGVFAGFGFQRLQGRPVLAIGAGGEGLRRASPGGVVVSRKVTAVLEADHIEAGVRVREFRQTGRRPGDARVERVGDADAAGPVRTGVEAKVIAFDLHDGGLYDAALGRDNGPVARP